MAETCEQQEASRPTEYMMTLSSQAHYDPLRLRPYNFAEAEATAEAQDAIAIQDADRKGAITESATDEE